MKRILLITAIAMFLLGFQAQAQAVFFDGFENWTNPELAVNWSGSIGGHVWGGEFNQIYIAGQGISCGGDGTNYKSVYRDIPVTPGYIYNAKVEVISNSTNIYGEKDDSYVKLWMQVRDVNENILSSHARSHSLPISDQYFTVLLTPGTTYGKLQAHHVRIILQVMGGTGGGTVFTNFNLYRLDGTWPNQSYTRVSGPDFIRNTEWLNKSTVQQLWKAYSEGGGPGDYVMRATSGSSQGISCGGSAGGYRDLCRTFNIADYRLPGATTNQASVYVTSNALNQKGVKDPDQVQMFMQFLDSSNRLVGTAAVSGSQFGVNSQDAVKMTISEPTPSGATKILVIMRVLAGTGGGAVFDDFELSTM